MRQNLFKNFAKRQVLILLFLQFVKVTLIFHIKVSSGNAKGYGVGSIGRINVSGLSWCLQRWST